MSSKPSRSLPRGRAPKLGQILRNPKLSETYERILREAESTGQKPADHIEAARGSFYKGFVAEQWQLVLFLRHAP